MVVMQWQDFWVTETPLFLETQQEFARLIFYEDDEIVVASERPVIQTANVAFEKVQELQPETFILSRKTEQLPNKKI